MIEVIKSGIRTSIQDQGRFGYRNQGVPLSGAMDQFAAQIANQMLGNLSSSSAVMEFVFQGPQLLFHQAATVAIRGGDWDITLNGKQVQNNQPLQIEAESTLHIKGARKGMYGYLAIQGGFETPRLLGSQSYYAPITQQSSLQKGDQIPFKSEANETANHQHASIAPSTHFQSKKVIQVEKGPEFEKLEPEVQDKLFSTLFSLSKDCNRMAYPLEHNQKLGAEEITTAAVQPGTVQLTPSGQLVVLMRDAQTTGGYARVLQLSQQAINQLAQQRPGEKVQFSL